LLDLKLEDGEFVDTLSRRAQALFGDRFQNPETCRKVAEQLLEKRRKLRNAGEIRLPGQAEYFDHLEAILAIKQYEPDRDEEEAIAELAALTYNKFDD